MPYRKSKSTSDRLAFIDSLRGIAALMVVILHVAYIPSPSLKLLPWARRLINAGQTGVILFFIISAFTLCLSAQSRSTCSTPFETRDFYIRRLFRIMPLYLVSIPIAWVRDLIVYNYQRPPLETIWSSLSIVDPGNSRGLVWASWTLGVELLFYLLFPLFFKLCTNLWRTIVTFAASVSINLAQSATLFANRDIEAIKDSASIDPLIRYGFLHNLPFFLLGTIFYYIDIDWLDSRKLSPALERSILLMSVFLFLLALYIYPQGILSVFYGGNFLGGVLLFMVMIGVSSARPKWLINNFTAKVGLVSYSVYWLHPPVIALLQGFYRSIYSWGASQSLSYLFCLLITLAIVIPLSIITFTFIEKPGIKLGNSLIKQL